MVTAAAEPVALSGPDGRPGLAVDRLVRLMSDCVSQMRIDLRGAIVVTEAATGPYAVTPVLAAMASADEVVGVTRPTRYGSVDDVRRQTFDLAVAAGVQDRIQVSDAPAYSLVGCADVVTNSGHLRPIDRDLVAAMKPTAVVPLMFEAWEIQAGRVDLDLDALRRKGIAVAGTNERHPLVDVFSYLGPMAVKLLFDAGTAVRGTRIAVLCDNPFAPYLATGLRAAGATVRAASSGKAIESEFRPDIVLVALRPRGEPVLDAATTARIAREWPDAIVAQFWGDFDRTRLEEHGLRYWPLTAPGEGHMGVLPSDVGPEPVVRLQAGGLKVSSVLMTPPKLRSALDLAFLDELPR